MNNNKFAARHVTYLRVSSRQKLYAKEKNEVHTTPMSEFCIQFKNDPKVTHKEDFQPNGGKSLDFVFIFAYNGGFCIKPPHHYYCCEIDRIWRAFKWPYCHHTERTHAFGMQHFQSIENPSIMPEFTWPEIIYQSILHSWIFIIIHWTFVCMSHWAKLSPLTRGLS